MSWFKRRKPAEPQPVVDQACLFCGAPGAGLTEVRDSAYREVHGLCCARCLDVAARFEDGVRHASTPGHSRWVLADPGTEREVRAGPDQEDAVRAALADLGRRPHPVPRAAARMAALRLGVYAAEADEPPAGSRAAAVSAIAGMIAADLARAHHDVHRYLDGQEYRVYSVALFGAGRGVLLQEVTTDGDRLRQHCFVVDKRFGVHRYRAYDR